MYIILYIYIHRYFKKKHTISCHVTSYSEHITLLKKKYKTKQNKIKENRQTNKQTHFFWYKRKTAFWANQNTSSRRRVLPELVPDKVQGCEVAAQRSQGDLRIQTQLLQIFGQIFGGFRGRVREISGEISGFLMFFCSENLMVQVMEMCLDSEKLCKPDGKGPFSIDVMDHLHPNSGKSQIVFTEIVHKSIPFPEIVNTSHDVRYFLSKVSEGRCCLCCWAKQYGVSDNSVH